MFLLCTVYLFFVFKHKTEYEMRISYWSSDVCSSDLSPEHRRGRHTVLYAVDDPFDDIADHEVHVHTPGILGVTGITIVGHKTAKIMQTRSEERREGKECVRTRRARWSEYN